MSTSPDRPRSRRVRAGILSTCADLLRDGGLAAATTDAVARRSGASKATIYKHWPNRLGLAIDAFTEIMTDDVVPPDTGTTRGDLEAHIALVVDFYARPAGRLYAELLAASVTDPPAAELLRTRFLAVRRELVERTWQRGVERGDIDPSLDFQAINDVLFGPVIFRLISGHAPLDSKAGRELAAVALAGVAPERSPLRGRSR